ncbi:hypothetical protein, partial [Klebsiella pneumoniae]|uniref:hypothetical protein n=1 Tax=Klebsiella pneumoniae TaxID=573 RepID=UPI002730E685
KALQEARNSGDQQAFAAKMQELRQQFKQMPAQDKANLKQQMPERMQRIQQRFANRQPEPTEWQSETSVTGSAGQQH